LIAQRRAEAEAREMVRHCTLLLTTMSSSGLPHRALYVNAQQFGAQRRRPAEAGRTIKPLESHACSSARSASICGRNGPLSDWHAEVLAKNDPA
jgi:hypothetical protein